MAYYCYIPVLMFRVQLINKKVSNFLIIVVRCRMNGQIYIQRFGCTGLCEALIHFNAVLIGYVSHANLQVHVDFLQQHTILKIQ